MKIIQIVLKNLGITGFAIMPNISEAEVAEIILNLKKGSRVGFIDLAPSNEIMNFMRRIEEIGNKVVAFFDHHLDEPGSSRVEILMKGMIEKRINCVSRINSRSTYPSSVHLVAFGEWQKLGVNVVMFHADADGFFGFLKGCGLSYPGMDDDADILDGAAKGRKLSETGKLLADYLQYVVPAFSINSERHRLYKNNLFWKFAAWVEDECQPDDLYAVEFRQEADKAAKKAKEIAMILIETATVLPGGVVIGDFLYHFQQGEAVAIPLWKTGILRKFGPVLLCSTGLGHMGEQMFIELPKVWQGKYDLRDFLPAGVKGRAPFRVQVPLDKWPEFLQNWRKREK